MQRQILRLKDVVELVGLSKTTIWRRTRAGEFPPALRLGGPSTRAVGWKMTTWRHGLSREVQLRTGTWSRQKAGVKEILHLTLV